MHRLKRTTKKTPNGASTRSLPSENMPLNFQKPSKLFLSGVPTGRASRPSPGTPQLDARSRTPSAMATFHRGSVSATGFRSSSSHKQVVKSPAVEAACRKFHACGRSSDHTFGIPSSAEWTIATLPGEVATKPNEGEAMPKVSDQSTLGSRPSSASCREYTNLLRSSTPSGNRALGELEGLNNKPWIENSLLYQTDLDGGGEGRTEGNEEEDALLLYDDEEESPQARNKSETLGAREARRAEHCAIMENIARSVAPKDMESYLKDKGFFSYNYNVHARTTMSKLNLKNGKKKGVERLMLLLTFA